MANKSKPWPVITKEELSKHNTKSDGWISIKGRVFDIGWYINTHPGGVEPLMQYLGKDGTKAFNSVHPYVNFTKILKGYEKGILEGTPQPTKPKPDKNAKFGDDDNADDKESEVGQSCCGFCSKAKDHRCPATSFYDSPGAVIYEITFEKQSLKMVSQEEDWSVGLEEDKQLFTVKKYVDLTNVWVACFRISQPVSYEYIECSFSDKFNTCKITLKKSESGVTWEKLGVPQSISNTITSNTSPKDVYSAIIVHKQKLSFNVNLIGIQLRACVKFGLLIGHHVNMHLKDIKRSYTPVCYSILGRSVPTSISRVGQVFWFIIKTYKTKGLTENLDQLPVSDAAANRMSSRLSKTSNKSTTSSTSSQPHASFKSELKISSPQGNFDPKFLTRSKDDNGSILVMFAAGTGITPMTRILLDISKKFITGQPCSQCHVILMFWNKTEDDIIWGEDFQSLSNTKSTKKEKWFSYFPVLTHPTSSWTGLTGRPAQEHVTIMENAVPDHKGEKQALICGPTGFCQSVQSIITTHLRPFSKEDIYVFKG